MYDFPVEYGSSDIYSREDMDEAIQVILEEFEQWKGCELHSLRYASDECNNEENIAWMNQLSEGKELGITFTQCIEFISDFHTPAEPDADSSFNSDYEYTDWTWYLAREDGGEWHLMTYGY
ncbi:MAG: hypothetical protein K5637_07230 [Lachnospiraceae bacterium]|nr:hypothetical protein [Lachnospiraceae bacterium]